MKYFVCWSVMFAFVCGLWVYQHVTQADYHEAKIY